MEIKKWRGITMFVVARDIENGKILLGGLGAMGVGKRWQDEQHSDKDIQGYESAKHERYIDPENFGTTFKAWQDDPTSDGLWLMHDYWSNNPVLVKIDGLGTIYPVVMYTQSGVRIERKGVFKKAKWYGPIKLPTYG